MLAVERTFAGSVEDEAEADVLGVLAAVLLLQPVSARATAPPVARIAANLLRRMDNLPSAGPGGGPSLRGGIAAAGAQVS